MTDGLIVVDECLEHLGRAAYRDVIVVGNGGGNKAGGAFRYDKGLVRVIY